MTRRQDGPGGYQTFFPLAHRKKRTETVIKVDALTEDEKERIKLANRRKSKEQSQQRTDRSQARNKLGALFPGEPVAVKRLSESISPDGCTAMLSWVEAIGYGRLDALPHGLEPLFQLPSRRFIEQYFEKWLCRFCPDDRAAAVERMRRAACQHLLAKSQKNFINPHQEILQFVGGLSPFLLYEIAYTHYQPAAISRLSQALRRNGRMRES